MTLICLAMSICAYCSVYSPYETNVEYNKYSTISSSYQYEFKSTSPYTPMVQYQTVKPLDRNGFVSSEYTTHRGSYKPRKSWGNLGDLDEDEQTPGEMVPIGEPIVPLLIIMFAYLSYRRLKIQR